MSEIQKISLGVVINNESEILIVNRANKEKLDNSTILSWVFPGGKIEQNENSENAVIREVFEETGYEVKVETLIYEDYHLHFPVFVSYWGCSLSSDINIETNDISIDSYAWISLNSLNKYITSPLNPMVEQYLNERLC